MRARRAIGRTATAVVLAMVVLAGGLVPNAPTASAALPDSIPFEVEEHYHPGGVASIADNTYIYSCRYIVLALFDEDEAFLAPAADGTMQPHIMAKRANQPTATKQRVIKEIPEFTYRVGPWDLGGRATMPKIEIPDGKLAYIWYAVQTDHDEYNLWAPTTTLCSQIAQLRASGQSPTNARNLLGLYPESSPLDVVLTSDGGNKDIGDQVPVSMKITNTATAPIEEIDVLGEVGLEFNTDYLGLVSGPDPQPPTTLAPGESVTLNYVVETLRTGRIEIKGGAEGTLNGAPTSEYATTIVMIPPELEIALSSSVTTATKVGDEFTVTATLTNHDEDDIPGIRAEPLSPQPDGRVSPVSGPTTAEGNDPRTSPFTLASGASTTVTWTLLADVAGSVELTAQISGRDPREDSLFFLSESLTVGIEAPALEISDLRLQPGSPVPGDFGILRGTLTNVGSLEVSDIDFTLEGTPKLWVSEGPLAELDPSVSPRIPLMAEGESRDFLIPLFMEIDPGDLATYTADVTFAGRADVGGVDTEITTVGRTVGTLELATYWKNIYDEVLRQLQQDTLDFFEGVNTWGEQSTLAGVSVGAGQGVLNAFQKLGDGLLLPADLLGNTIGSGGVNLTDPAKAMVEAIREYRNTTTPKKML
ncbi:MAG: COG1361 family protein, partial [Microthrixaceae bacterium]